MELTFTNATEQDIDPIFSFCKELINRYEDPSGIDYIKVLNWVYRKISENISSYTCVYLNGQKAGFYRFVPEEDTMELDDLYIFPQFRNQGIGTYIIQKCCRETDLPVMLYVFTQNTGALSLYQRLGFHVKCTVSATRCIMIRNPHPEQEVL